MEMLGPIAVGAAIVSSYFLSKKKKKPQEFDYNELDGEDGEIEENEATEEVREVAPVVEALRVPKRIPIVEVRSIDHGGQQWPTERLCRDVFETYFKVLFPKESKFVRNPLTNRYLELDGYNKELKVAFEYQGEQHYHAIPNGFVQNRDQLADQVWRDHCKKSACKQRGIRLFVISYRLKYKDNDEIRKRKRTALEIRKELTSILERDCPRR